MFKITFTETAMPQDEISTKMGDTLFVCQLIIRVAHQFLPLQQVMRNIQWTHGLCTKPACHGCLMCQPTSVDLFMKVYKSYSGVCPEREPSISRMLVKKGNTLEGKGGIYEATIPSLRLSASPPGLYERARETSSLRLSTSPAGS